MSSSSVEQTPSHREFTAWAEEQGVRIHGLAPASLPGKGVGIVATRKLKKGDILLEIPASALITHDTEFVRDAGFDNATVYGAVAAALTLQHENEERWFKTWQATWPSFEDVQTSMPLCWPTALQGYLTPSTRARFEYQKRKFDRDWESVGPRIPVHLKKWFKYYWLIVDSRCFFWEFFEKARKVEEGKRVALKKGRGGKRRRVDGEDGEVSLEKDEYLALVPWGDFFNHADEGCRVFFTEEQVRIECNRAYSKSPSKSSGETQDPLTQSTEIGEEVVTSYGNHSNDYLLIDYGFILSSNKHDTLTLDHIILPLLTASQTTFLSESNYLGQYILSAEGVCYRTQVAIRTLAAPAEKLQDFIDGVYDGAAEEGVVNAKVLDVLGVFEKQAKMAIGELEGMRGRKKKEEEEEGEEEYAIDVLRRRWVQVVEMIDLVREDMSKT